MKFGPTTVEFTVTRCQENINTLVISIEYDKDYYKTALRIHLPYSGAYLYTFSLSNILLQAGVSLIWLRYEMPQNNNRVVKLSSLCENVVRVSLPAPARVARRSQCDSKLLIACIDASIHIVHHTVGLTHSTRAGFVSGFFFII